MMADEKPLSQISHRLFTTSCSEMEIRVKNNADALIFHTALCAAGTTKLLFIAEPNKIWLAIPPALKCLRNEENAKNMLESIFFTRRFVSERKQISLIADEKSPARISHRSFATKSLRNGGKCENP